MIEAMKYTKWITVLFCLLGLAACRQDAPRFRIGVAQCSDDSWRHKMNDEILREAMFYDGVSVEIRSAADDNRKQAEDVHYFIDKGVDLLIISANEAAPMTPIVEEAYQKGIPVILVDRKILSDKYTAYIGADNYEIGRAVGNYIASSLKGKGNVVELTGLGGSTPAMERHQGFMAAISNYPDIKLIDKADAAWEREPAEVEMDSMLRRHPKIDAVYAHNDRIAPGAYQAAKKAGREKVMIFVGIDALPGKGNGLELVLDNVLDATFIYPTNGDKVMQLAMNILEKKSYPRETVMNTAVVDRTNAHVMQLQTTHISELDQKIETLNGRIGGYLSRVATQQGVMDGGGGVPAKASRAVGCGIFLPVQASEKGQIVSAAAVPDCLKINGFAHGRSDFRQLLCLKGILIKTGPFRIYKGFPIRRSGKDRAPKPIYQCLVRQFIGIHQIKALIEQPVIQCLRRAVAGDHRDPAGILHIRRCLAGQHNDGPLAGLVCQQGRLGGVKSVGGCYFAGR